MNIPSHKQELRLLMLALGMAVATALVGKGKGHAVAGTLFGLLCARHIWKRRKAL